MPSANVVQTSVSGGQQNALALQGDGVFLPKLSTATRTALTLGTSDKGFLAYDTTDNNVYIWNGAAWESIPASGDSSNTQVIFNDNGILAGDTGLTYDKTTDALTVAGNIGIGTSLSAWGGVFKALQVNRAGLRGSTATTGLSFNAYFDGTTFRYIGAGLNALDYYQNSGKHVWQIAGVAANANDPILFTQTMEVDTSGNLGLATGNLVVSNGKGIDFSATPQPAGATSELLSDYEEGTFVPTITASTGTPTTTTVNLATYTKIGRLVSVTIDISIVNIGTASNLLQFTLPFSQGTDTNIGALREVGATASMGQIGSLGGSAAFAALYNNATVWVNGYRIRGTYNYTV